MAEKVRAFYTEGVTNDINNVFKKLTEAQKKELFKSVVKRQLEILCKTSQDTMFSVRPLSLEKEVYLLCEKEDDSIHVASNESLVISFKIDAEKYFMFTSLVDLGDHKWFRLTGTPELYQLQRRQAYRIRIPDSFRTSVQIRNEKTNALVAKGKLIDLSSGGCQINVPLISNFKNGSSYSFEISLGRGDSLTIPGEVRRAQVIEDEKPYETLGVLFKPVSSMVESKLFATIMELHRELVAKVASA